MKETPDFDNIVFEDRNKAYGAYHLRKFYGNSVFIGFLISAFVISAGFSSPVIYKAWFAEEKEVDLGKTIVVEMETFEEEKPKEPEPEKIPEKIPEVATVRNLELEVKPDKEVKKEEPPPSEDEMKDKNSAEETKEGEKKNPIEDLPKTEPKKEEVTVLKIETWAPEMPLFPGGPSEYNKYLKSHLEYSEVALSENIEGVVRVSFVVNVDGSISDVKIVQSLGYGLDEQALKVFRKMPKWKPARKGGREVPLRMTTPVTFTLE